MSVARVEPIQSRPWLGRCFTLAEGSLCWGRYEILDEKIGRGCEQVWPQIRSELGKVDPERLAVIFEHLIHIYIPGALPYYLHEMEALATLEYSKAHLSALQASNCSTDEVSLGKVAEEKSFERALIAVLGAAQPLHTFTDFVFVGYQQMHYGMHLADFSWGNSIYRAAFSSDLVLQCIDEMNNPRRVWTSLTSNNI